MTSASSPSGREVFSSAHKAKVIVDTPAAIWSRKSLPTSLLTFSSELGDSGLWFYRRKTVHMYNIVLWGVIIAFLPEMSFAWDSQPHL